MKKFFLSCFLLCTWSLCFSQSINFDNLLSHSGPNKTLTFTTSDWDQGFAHKLYNRDLGGGMTHLRIACRQNTTTWSDMVTFTVEGKVGIGTTSPDELLSVKGVIHAEKVKVDLSVPAPDYVFQENYPLRSLKELEAYIDTNSHLPDIPSAQQMEKEGVELSEMNMKLLQKIEELTLYLIEQNKKITQLEGEIGKLKNRD